MVAYSFQPQFVAAILSGRKAQTIRAARKRHARPGEQLQLYTGMRTKQCRKIGEAVCLFVRPISLDLSEAGRVVIERARPLMFPDGLDEFARSDGFKDWEQMRGFWKAATFTGFLIEWREFSPAAALNV